MVNLAIALLATTGRLVVGQTAFGVALPRQFLGFIVSFGLVAGPCSPSGC
jgi:hypothetical protein